MASLRQTCPSLGSMFSVELRWGPETPLGPCRCEMTFRSEVWLVCRNFEAPSLSHFTLVFEPLLGKLRAPSQGQHQGSPLGTSHPLPQELSEAGPGLPTAQLAHRC